MLGKVVTEDITLTLSHNSGIVQVRQESYMVIYVTLATLIAV